MSSKAVSLVWVFFLTGLTVLGLGSFRSFADSTQARGQNRIRAANGVVERLDTAKYQPGRLLVRYKRGTSSEKMQAMHLAIGARVLRALPLVSGLQLIQLAEGMTVPQALAHYRKDASVLYAEPDYIVHIVGAPNDPDFPAQWSLQNTGQNGGTAGADIHAVQAWSLTTGSPNVVVGVIDTGVDYNHQDLSANIWSATNGYSVTTANGTTVKCAPGSHGFNMVADTCDPMDDNGHGTHVSGTIGAAGNNGVGVAGINWQVRILSCKFLDSTGAGSTDNAIACLNLMKELKDSGANIIVTNNSWGGGDSSQALHDAIAAAMDDGMLFIAAAGNDFSDNDDFPTYPANFYLPNVIAVAATDRNDSVVTFSNYGRRTVHIAAPGRDILSTTPNNTYGYDSGTSMATPHVTGVAALLKAQSPNLDWRAIKNRILSGGDATVAAQSTTISQKRLDAYGSLTCTTGRAASRLLPVSDMVSGSVGIPLTVAYLNILCGQPAGNVSVTIAPGNKSLALIDDGTGSDISAGDGIYTGQWTPTQPGNYTLSYPDGSTSSVQVLTAYGYTQTTYQYRAITGTNLNLSDDAVATIASPFPVAFGGGQFTNLFVSSNGTISFTSPFDSYLNFPFTPSNLSFNETVPTTLVAPMWADLYPIKGTNQNVFWSVTGSAPNRELVIEWRSVPAFACRSDKTETVTFQAVFDENSSSVLFNYSNVVFGGTCSDLDYGQYATVGLLSSPSQGVVWSDGSGPALNNGLALLWQTPPPTPGASSTPVLTSISPSNVPLFSPDTTITVRGSNFAPAAVVQWQNTNVAPLPPGVDLPTTYVSSTQLVAILPSAFSAPNTRYDDGTVQSLLVTNPGNPSLSSNTLPITITYPGKPSISSLSPSTAYAGDFSLYMDVLGNNLYGATIYWNGTLLFTTEISNTEVYAAVPSSLLIAPGTAQVTAVANAPNGGTSTAVPFTIGPAPVLSAAAVQSIAQQAASHLSIDASGKPKPSFPAIHQPPKFLGWNYGRRQGPAYLKYFSRGYAAGGIGPGAAAKSNNSTPASPSNNATPQVSLSQPSTLPGFAFHPTLPAGFLPTGVATGDFNHDGKVDWVVSNGGSNDLWVYFGNGDGTAKLPKIIRLTGAGPVQVVAADLRKTGVLDLIVAEADSQSVGILLGNGDGTFQSEVTYFVQGPPVSVAVGDVNGDGKPDVVVGILGGGSVAGPLVTMLGDGTGKLGAPLPTPSIDDIGFYLTTSIVLKDLNGDGLLDAVVVDEGGVVPGAHSYLSVGDGTFKHADYFFESDGGLIVVTNVAVADVDGDGCADAVTVEGLGLARVFRGTCDGSFQGFPNVLTLGAGEASVGVALADMNGDGKLDLITAGGYFGVDPGLGEEASNLITVLAGDGKGNFASPKVFRSEPSNYGFAVADVNGDGKLDIVAASQDTDTASVLLNDGQGNLNAPNGAYVGYFAGGQQQGAVNATLGNFFVQDFNGDGKPDLGVIEAERMVSTPFNFGVLLNDGTGHFGPLARTPITDFQQFPSGIIFGDFRNTGHTDAVVSATANVSNGSTTVLTFLPNNGSGVFSGPYRSTIDPTKVSSLFIGASGDFNGDGKLDLVGVGTPPGSTKWGVFSLLGNGDGTFHVGAFTLSGVPTATTQAFAGDYNHDGKLDVLVWGFNNTQGAANPLSEFLGNGDGTFAAPKIILPDLGFFGMADLNHDGYPDIVEFHQVLASSPTGFFVPTINIYLGQPDGSFKKTQTYSPYPGLASLGQTETPMLADFNGDGNIDIGVTMSSFFPYPQSYMQILAGNGDGTFTPTYEITPFGKRGTPGNAADVTGDGHADLLELDGWPSSYHVIPETAGPTVQLALASQPIVGNKGTLQVSLSLIPSTAASVQLSASDPNIQVPATVNFPAGTVRVAVPFTIGTNFNSTQVFSISAQLSGVTTTIFSYQTLQSLAGFQLFTNATRESTPPGGTSQDYGIGIISTGGYAATVQLSCQGLPAGATCQFGANPLTLAPGQGVGSSLMIQTSSSTPTGTYKVTVSATDGAISNQLSLTLAVADFAVSITPAAVTILPGAVANYNLQLTTNSGWTDLINVSCAISGAPQAECTAGGTYFVGLSLFQILTGPTMTAGDYTITISGSADGITHNASAVLHVGGASGTISPNSATVSVGGTAKFNVTLNSQDGYSDQFTFGCPAAPVGLTCSFAPPSGPLSPSGSLATVLTVTVNARPAATPNSPQVRGVTGQVAPWLLLAFASLALAIWPRVRRPKESWSMRLATACAVLFLMLSIVSCGGGGGSSGSNPPPPPPPPPPPTSVTVSVQAVSSSLSVNVGTVTLQVQ